VNQEQFDRIGLLLARLIVEASDGPASTFGAAFGDGQWAKLLASEVNTLALVRSHVMCGGADSSLSLF
jgi:hypothetical protein